MSTAFKLADNFFSFEIFESSQISTVISHFIFQRSKEMFKQKVETCT